MYNVTGVLCGQHPHIKACPQAPQSSGGANSVVLGNWPLRNQTKPPRAHQVKASRTQAHLHSMLSSQLIPTAIPSSHDLSYLRPIPIVLPQEHCTKDGPHTMWSYPTGCWHQKNSPQTNTNSSNPISIPGNVIMTMVLQPKLHNALGTPVQRLNTPWY